ncbi:hypothetical protein E1B28_004705 [Marasmius oreades]|uniref:Hepatocellular carcinoma-associated antigen 59-domain-containing protein n=1 Tax=Marasmius oreades TaxID=181124 RepID=A0A9P7UZ55_9AGAR|nr:uncharacterized protein E1B28_004705 [Marasmius oreades]KAG7097354.1 hypothetical protein E1B28_004705 [Marasmius oreades]
MIKKRTRPQPRVREVSLEVEDTPNDDQDEEEEEKLPLADLLELRKLRKNRQGIDVAKLTKGDVKKKRKKEEAEEDEDGKQEDTQQQKSRKAVRASNFTQQTNALNVDKHMMAYIEENLKVRSQPKEDDDVKSKPLDPQEALYQVPERWKVEHKKSPAEEGSITNSMAMLTAIPEVDLGMDTRLKNIEDTEKAKRVVAEERSERRTIPKGEEHLVASRFYRPNLKMRSDADIMRDAKLQAMGILTQDDQHKKSNHDKPQMATDELVMERFKKRMRK